MVTIVNLLCAWRLLLLLRFFGSLRRFFRRRALIAFDAGP
jgi:hypothetical protein